MGFIARVISLLLALLLAACMGSGGIKPDFVIEGAHSSGSLVAVDADRPLAASAGLEGTLALWDLDDGRKRIAWKGHQGTVNGLAVSSRLGRVISGGWDGRLVAWSLKGRLIRQVDAGAPVTAMAFSTDLSQIWTGHSDGSLRRWDPDLKLVAVWQVPDSRRVTAMALALGRLAVADHGGNVWLFRNDADSSPVRLATLPAYVRSLEFRPDGKVLFGGSWFRLYRWELESGRMFAFSTPHRGIIASLDWSPASGQLMSISRQTDSSVLALDPETGALQSDFGNHDLCGASVAVSPDGRYLVTTSDDASVRIWRLGNRSPR